MLWQSCGDVNWDDLRILLAVARHGTLSAAARDLGVNHSTVSRRLSGLEEAFGARLFDRLPNGFIPTGAGRDALSTARRVEAEILELDHRVLGQDQRLSGVVRLTTVDLIAVRLTTVFGEFVRLYPNVELTISVDNAPLNLLRREADVALRLTVDQPPDSLVGRCLATVEFALYGARSLLQTHGVRVEDGPISIEALPWISWDERVGARLTHAWMQRHISNAQVAVRVDSSFMMIESIRQGLGIGFLTCFDGESDPGLVRLGPPVPGFSMQLWLLIHPDLRTSARVRAFTDHIRASIAPWVERFSVPHLISHSK